MQSSDITEKKRPPVSRGRQAVSGCAQVNMGGREVAVAAM